MNAADILIDAAVKSVLGPLLERARELGEPVLAYVPDELEEVAVEKLLGFAGDILRAGLALLQAHGKVTIATTGEITITHHAGAHPDTREG